MEKETDEFISSRPTNERKGRGIDAHISSCSLSSTKMAVYLLNVVARSELVRGKDCTSWLQRYGMGWSGEQEAHLLDTESRGQEARSLCTQSR